MKVQPTAIQDVKIADLVLDRHIQMRAALSRSAILDYADAMKGGATFPPIIVFYRQGVKKYYVADGFHRVLAAKKLGRKTIQAEVRDGTRRDAILFAVGANLLHGVRRTNEDKRKAVVTLLSDKEWSQWADTEVARACAVTAPMVGRYRQWMTAGQSGKVEDVRKYIDRTGRERTITVPKADPDLGKKLVGECCPYCGRPMPKG